ncbi:MAG: hypothetical protein EXR71_04590 [Myxococcales bacterium]|nr:hypothetical protein [Myxococcales bacterium]
MILLVAAGLAAEPVLRVVSATPFVLLEPYRSDWSAAHPVVRGGTVLVLQVDPALLSVTDMPRPVLYVGEAPVEVLARDVDAGQVRVVVPGPLGTEAFVYFGGAALPEMITAEAGARELAAARAGGLAALRIPASLTARTVRDHAALAAR